MGGTLERRRGVGGEQEHGWSGRGVSGNVVEAWMMCVVWLRLCCDYVVLMVLMVLMTEWQFLRPSQGG